VTEKQIVPDGSPLTGKREQAAQLVAAGRLSFDAIAAKLEITDRGLYNWRLDPVFRARVDAINAQFAETMQQYGIAQRARRIAALDDRRRRLENLIYARAEAYAHATGGDTGLIVEQIKATGEGSYQSEWVFDAAVVRELRAHEEQAAKELGQWVEKVAPTAPSGEKAYEPIDLTKLSLNDLRDLQRLADKAVIAPGD